MAVCQTKLIVYLVEEAFFVQSNMNHITKSSLVWSNHMSHAVYSKIF